MNEKLFIFSHCLKFRHIIHDMTASSTHQQVFAKGISWAPGVSRAVNSR